MGGGTGTDVNGQRYARVYVRGYRQQLIPYCLPLFNTWTLLYLSRGETGDETERPGAGLEATGRERNLERGQATICRTDNILMVLSTS